MHTVLYNVSCILKTINGPNTMHSTMIPKVSINANSIGFSTILTPIITHYTSFLKIDKNFFLL